MSGGVDSSVTALKMLEQGYECMGMTMKLFNKENQIADDACGGSEDIRDAKSVCQRLGIEHQVVDFSHRFKQEVIDRFVKAYENGQTPNPCILCNRYLKFDQLCQEAIAQGYDYVATGHYARIRYDEAKGRYLLLKAYDDSKDQSYVLYSLSQQQLAHAQFPLGELHKTEVRAIAEAHGFSNAHKHDSQDICFVPKDSSYTEFIEKKLGHGFPPGNFIDTKGKILGRHKGIIYYTVGQRKGLGLALPEPMYVQRLDVKKNTVVLCTNQELFTTKVRAVDINLIDCESIPEPRRVKARIRYHAKEEWATVTQPHSSVLLIEFDEPQRAITKGQSVVLYDGEVVVGGGIIA